MNTKRSLMAYRPSDSQSSLGERSSEGGEPVPTGYASGVPPLQYPGGDRPRLVEEHHVVGPRGEDEIEATDDRGRRWYHLRPEPRGRADFIGFNYTWWLIWVVFILVIFLPWGRGWGY
jgi:hypothetical protein